jgi:hypothetical protein
VFAFYKPTPCHKCHVLQGQLSQAMISGREVYGHGYVIGIVVLVQYVSFALYGNRVV